MRVRRVLVRDLCAGEVSVVGVEAHHLNVLRLSPGDPVRAFDGHGRESQGEVMRVEAARVVLRLAAPKQAASELPFTLTLAVALLKGDKLAEVVRHGTELGAHRFVLLLTRRCDAKTLSGSKRVRWQRVAQEAAKQSGRSVVPEVAPLTPLADLTRGDALGLVAHPTAPRTLQDILNPASPPTAIMSVTGPEGGLTDDEVALLVERGFATLRLGPRILRAETAPVALAAALVLPEAR